MNADAQRQVTGILADFGWPSSYLEAMCIAWVLYGVATGGWNHAFKVLRK